MHLSKNFLVSAEGHDRWPRRKHPQGQVLVHTECLLLAQPRVLSNGTDIEFPLSLPKTLHKHLWNLNYEYGYTPAWAPK
jgi:hypothetical protein